MNIDHELDLRGRTCPLPVLALRRFFLARGDAVLVRVRVTDPDSARDIPTFSDRHGYDVVDASMQSDEWTFIVRRR